MKRRFRYSYSVLDLAYNFLVPVKLFCCCKRSLRNLHSRYLLFKRAEHRFAAEFDAVEFARSQRKLKMLMHWLMDKSERFLTAYQKSNAVSLSPQSASSASDDPAYTKIPKMLSDSKTKQKHVVLVDKFFVSLSADARSKSISEKSTPPRTSTCCTASTRQPKTTVRVHRCSLSAESATNSFVVFGLITGIAGQQVVTSLFKESKENIYDNPSQR